MPEAGEPIRVHVLSRDERVIRAALSLPRGAYEVTHSTSSADALPHLRHTGVAVIDLDRSGFSVTREIRAHAGEGVRVVMLCDRPHDIWLCRQAGADEVLTKPLSDPSLLTRAITAVPRGS